MNRNVVKGIGTVGRCILFLGSMVGVLAAQDTATTRTTLSIAVKDAGPHTRLTLTAHVSSTDGEESPAGVVTFRSGDLDLGSAVVGSEGEASLQTDILPQGDHRVIAFYRAPSGYQSSRSAEELVHANLSTVAGFTVSATPSSLSTPVGGFVTSVIAVTPVNGFNAIVSLSCAGLPFNATCTFTPTNVTATCTAQSCAPVTSVMQIQTVSAVKPAVESSAAFVFPVLFGLAGLGVWKRRSWANLALTFLVFAAALGMTGCNARYNYLKHGPPDNTGTPVGAYTVIVEAESSTGSETITPPTQPTIALVITAPKN